MYKQLESIVQPHPRPTNILAYRKWRSRFGAGEQGLLIGSRRPAEGLLASTEDSCQKPANTPELRGWVVPEDCVTARHGQPMGYYLARHELYVSRPNLWELVRCGILIPVFIIGLIASIRFHRHVSHTLLTLWTKHTLVQWRRTYVWNLRILSPFATNQIMGNLWAISLTPTSTLVAFIHWVTLVIRAEAMRTLLTEIVSYTWIRDVWYKTQTLVSFRNRYLQ